MAEPLRVLVVEDSEDDTLLLLHELRRGGYEPTHRRVDTEQAMKDALREREWDLVVSDHSMPNFSSSAALELLRSEGYMDLPFIIVSGQIGEDSAVMAMKSGAQDYLMKDNLRRLNSAIERELREAKVRRERRRAEEAKRQAEEKYRGIFENAVEGIFQSTADGAFVIANPALARMFGYESPEELMRSVSSIGEQLYVDPEHRAELDRLVRRDGFVLGFESQMYRADGSVMWASVSARAVRDARGEFAGFEGTLEDITARKNAEKALREIREVERRRISRELHDVVLQDLTFVLQSMQLSRAVAATAGSGGEAGGVAEEERDRQIEALRRSVKGLRDAIYDLRLEGVREQPLVHSLEALVELNRQMAPEREIEFVVEEGFPDSISGISGVEMTRMVQEALANVRRHSGAQRVEVRLSFSDDEVCITIEDDGQGFDRDTVPGVGLTGMRERALALGGDLDVSGKPGVGTRVCFRAALSTLTEPNLDEAGDIVPPGV